MSTVVPPATAALIALNIGMFIQQSFAPVLTVDLALWPIGGEWLVVPQAGFEPYQVLTYGFLHGSVPHLLFNMFGLYMFGSDIESIWGQRRFITYYLVSIVTAAVAQLAVTWMTGAVYPTVGASGGG